MSIENHLYGNEPSGYVGTSYSAEAAAPLAENGGYVYTVQAPNGVDIERKR